MAAKRAATKKHPQPKGAFDRTQDRSLPTQEGVRFLVPFVLSVIEPFFAEPKMLESAEWKPKRPTKIIFRSGNQEIFNRLRQNYPDAAVKNIRDIYGEALFSVATLS